MILPGCYTLPDDRTAEVVELEGGGLRARVATLGAALLNLWVPDATGRVDDVVLGHAVLEGYLDDPAYLGMAIGRTAGRVAGGCVVIDGEECQLDVNDGPNTLHGGPCGFHQRVWTVEERAPHRITLVAESPDGEGGYPGALRVLLTYTLADRALAFDWEAETTAPTPVSLTHHAYVHLDGHAAGSVRPLVVRSDAERYVPLGRDLLPTGETRPVGGTPFDLRRPVRLADVVDADHPQIQQAGGLDHDLLVPPFSDGVGIARRVPLRRVARVWGRRRGLDVWTTEPGVHIYAGGALDVAHGKGGVRYAPFTGLALEAQPPPDATRHAAFPDIVLRLGEPFSSRTVWRFHTDPVPTSGLT